MVFSAKMEGKLRQRGKQSQECWRLCRGSTEVGHFPSPPWPSTASERKGQNFRRLFEKTQRAIAWQGEVRGKQNETTQRL